MPLCIYDNMKQIALTMFEKILILFFDDIKKKFKNILLKVTPL